MADLQENEVAFLGKITAGVTHEIKNVLAIIKESSGLIEDLMAMAPESPSFHERYQRALANIKAQVQRGIELTKNLNKLAHSPDVTVKQVDLSEITEQLIELSQRFARLKNVVLKTCPPKQPEQPIQLVTNSIQLLMALFAGVECWLSLASSGNQINIYPLKKEDAGFFTLQCEGDFPGRNELAHCLAKVETWPLLQDILTSLGGHVEIDETAAGLLLFFPNLKTIDKSSI